MKLTVDYKESKFGIIYIDFGNRCFPSDGWEDFYVYILEDWKDVLSENSDLVSSSFKLYFMDGAYYMNCEKKNTYLTVQGIDEKRNNALFEETVIFTDFRETVENKLKYILEAKNEAYKT